jgi:hypothetical protein
MILSDEAGGILMAIIEKNYSCRAPFQQVQEEHGCRYSQSRMMCITVVGQRVNLETSSEARNNHTCGYV